MSRIQEIDNNHDDATNIYLQVVDLVANHFQRIGLPDKAIYLRGMKIGSNLKETHLTSTFQVPLVNFIFEN